MWLYDFVLPTGQAIIDINRYYQTPNRNIGNDPPRTSSAPLSAGLIFVLTPTLHCLQVTRFRYNSDKA